jgi:hypothetical protein
MQEGFFTPILISDRLSGNSHDRRDLVFGVRALCRVVERLAGTHSDRPGDGVPGLNLAAPQSRQGGCAALFCIPSNFFGEKAFGKT